MKLGENEMFIFHLFILVWRQKKSSEFVSFLYWIGCERVKLSSKKKKKNRKYL